MSKNSKHAVLNTISKEALCSVVEIYENKLEEVLSAEEFEEIVRSAARSAFRIDLEQMEDSQFKTFVLSNFDKITEV